MSSGALNALNTIRSMVGNTFSPPEAIVSFKVLDDGNKRDIFHDLDIIQGSFDESKPSGKFEVVITLTSSELEKLGECEEFRKRTIGLLDKKINHLANIKKAGNPNKGYIDNEIPRYYMDFWNEDENGNSNTSDSINDSKLKSALNKYQTNFSYLG